MTFGPVEYALVEFPGSKFSGEIAPELQRLEESGMVHVIDLLFITKDLDGNVLAVELSALEEDEAAPFHQAGVEFGNLLSEEDIEIAGERLEPGSSAALLVWENVWAKAFTTAVRNADGRLVAHDRIPAELVEAAAAAAAAA